MTNYEINLKIKPDHCKVILLEAVTKCKTTRRNRCIILYESIIFVKNNPGVPKTRLVYALNLSCTVHKQILDKLVKEGLIEIKMGKQYSEMYITDKGRRAIKLGKEFLTLLGYLKPTGAI